MKSSYLPIIGLEVHVELKTKSKMFCSCPNGHFGEKPNTNVCPVCLGLPGALPVPNLKAIEETMIITLAFGGKVNQNFWFDRKNYFYPDLPKGYQISQHFSPIGIGGQVPIVVDDQLKNVGVSDIHLEEDTGKSLHRGEKTYLDYNRSGVPLVEIVSQPTIHSVNEAKEYLKRIQQTIRWLGFSDCDMEKGSMRLEANISVKKSSDHSDQLPPYRVEVKNLNSFRFVEKAINYEVERQIQILEKGKTPAQETRGFDSKRGATFSQRSKEVARDYRYFPEPDIPPFKMTEEKLKKLKRMAQGMPWQAEEKIMASGIRRSWARIITEDRRITDLFFQTLGIGKGMVSAEEIASWMVNKKPKIGIKPGDLAKIVADNKQRFDLNQKEIGRICQTVIEENPKAVEDYRRGKNQAVGFLIGQVQRKTQGRADPKITAEVIGKLLKR